MPTIISGEVHGQGASSSNPLSVRICGSPDYVDLVDNPATVWAITRADGQPDNETITLANGKVYRRTFTYTGNLLTARSAWVLVP